MAAVDDNANSLEALGWDPTLDFYFSELGDEALKPARIVRVDRGRARLVGAEGERSGIWSERLAFLDGGVVGLPAVGDWCLYGKSEGADSESLVRIERIFPRRGVIARGRTSGSHATQVLAANVDVAFVVTGLDGDFSPRRIERYLTLARSGGVRPVVVLNKADLCSDLEAKRTEVEAVALGITILTSNALDEEAAAALEAELHPGQTAVFLGSSGVGKSTLTNSILGSERQATGAVRARDDTGRHTTTARELIVLPGGGIVIDTPGIREVGVVGDEASLNRVFADIETLGEACRFGDCSHQGEPGCAVQRAVEEGGLSAERLASYLGLRREAQSAALRADAHASRQADKKFGKMVKGALKDAKRLKGRK